MDVNNKIQLVTANDLEIAIDSSESEATAASFNQCIRVLNQNWRQGTVGCKDRSEVSYSTKKPWKQKGTGRARAGSVKSPLWRHGGVIFGPQPRVRELEVSKNMRKKVYRTLLSQYINSNKVMTLDFGLDLEKPKTSAAYNLLKNASLLGKRILVFLDAQDSSVFLSFSNIECVKMVSFDAPNAFNLSNADCWLVLKKDMALFKNMVEKWI